MNTIQIPNAYRIERIFLFYFFNTYRYAAHYVLWSLKKYDTSISSFLRYQLL